MSDVLLTALIGAGGALLAVIPSEILMHRANKNTAEAVDVAKQQTAVAETANRIAAQQTEKAAEANRVAQDAVAVSRQQAAAAEKANELAEQAVAEAKEARQLQYASWYKEATPDVALTAGSSFNAQGGVELIFSCDQDVDGVRLSLVRVPPQYLNFGPDPDKATDLVFRPDWEFPAASAGELLRAGLWVGSDQAVAGWDVVIRCEVTITNTTWPLRKVVSMPGLGVA